MVKQEIIEFSESLNNSPASLNEAQRILDFCLDLMNALNEKEHLRKFRNFDLRLSMNAFSFIIEEDSSQIEEVFWNNAIKELKFDIEGFLRNFEP
jgi:uncharacterized protein YigA (DUF484 family)